MKDLVSTIDIRPQVSSPDSSPAAQNDSRESEEAVYVPLFNAFHLAGSRLWR